MVRQYFKPPFGEVSVKVWGALACFTRPEFKVERVSYPVMTPSAARGIMEAILFKPEFSYAITRIEILRPLRFVSIRRNEVQKVVDLKRAEEKWITGKEPVEHILADIKGKKFPGDKEAKKQMRAANPLLTQYENTAQRNMLALADVAYNIFAEIVLQPEKAKLPGRRFGGLRTIDNVRKYQAAFTRRVAKGQCFHRPGLGCRELIAQFAPIDTEIVDENGSRLPCEPLKTYGIGEAGEPLGRMLYDVAYTNDGQPLYAKFFDAVVKQGILDTREAILARSGRLYHGEVVRGESEL